MGDTTALMKELLDIFRIEAQDHLDALGVLLVALESGEAGAESAKLVEDIFRRMHTLKGAAHAVNLLDVAMICQDLESQLSDLKRGEIPLERALFDRLHGGIDLISGRIFAPPEGGAAAGPGPEAAAFPQPSSPGAPPHNGAGHQPWVEPPPRRHSRGGGRASL